MISLDKYFVSVDPVSRIVKGQLHCLPETHENLSSLSSLSEDELEDLSWAGIENQGWVCFTSDLLTRYSSDSQNLESNKVFLKRKISEETEKRLQGGFVYQGHRVEASPNFRFHLHLETQKSLSKIGYHQFFRFDDKSVKLDCVEIRNLYEVLELFLSKNAQWEHELFGSIERCKDLPELAKLNYEYPWLCTTV